MTKGNIAGATAYLLAAGHSTGSPVLASFGPNMALARDLLQKGQSTPVLAYLDLCAQFWTNDHGAITKWKSEIQSGKAPDFGANLIY